MKLLYFGPLWQGSTSLQRLKGFQALPGLIAVGQDNGGRVGRPATSWHRLRWRLRWPVDVQSENRTLIEAVCREKPDVVFVDNSKVVRPSTLRRVRQYGQPKLVFYTPDDIIARHNLSMPLRMTFSLWDILFTTKTYNISELRERKVKRPRLIGKAFDPELHRPLMPSEVGPEFEAFDLVFAGSFERERWQSLQALAEAGFQIVLYSSYFDEPHNRWSHPNVTCRPAAYAEAYTRALHTGRLALCFLRKINRDRITQRSIEITAMGRPMLAEKTVEHDSHFADQLEYAGFITDSQLVETAHRLIHDSKLRTAMGNNGRRRCLESGYSVQDRAREMMEEIKSLFP